MNNTVMLTPRETEIIKLICLGYTDAQIGEVLGIARPTIRAHIRRILDNTDCVNRTALAVWWTQKGGEAP